MGGLDSGVANVALLLPNHLPTGRLMLVGVVRRTDKMISTLARGRSKSKSKGSSRKTSKITKNLHLSNLDLRHMLSFKSIFKLTIHQPVVFVKKSASRNDNSKSISIFTILNHSQPPPTPPRLRMRYLGEALPFINAMWKDATDPSLGLRISTSINGPFIKASDDSSAAILART